jgi:hypothetical protein
MNARFGSGLVEGNTRFESVLDQWYDPESISHKIRADDGNVYILRHASSRPDGEWVLVSFRQTG